MLHPAPWWQAARPRARRGAKKTGIARAFAFAGVRASASGQVGVCHLGVHGVKTRVAARPALARGARRERSHRKRCQPRDAAKEHRGRASRVTDAPPKMRRRAGKEPYWGTRCCVPGAARAVGGRGSCFWAQSTTHTRARAAGCCAACGAEGGNRGFTLASLLRAFAVYWCIVSVQVGAEEHG